MPNEIGGQHVPQLGEEDLKTHVSDDQKNCVKINNMTSTWKDQLRGCPQSSPLGSLLWILFQNDLSLNVHTSNLFMYADDHNHKNRLSEINRYHRY